MHTMKRVVVAVLLVSGTLWVLAQDAFDSGTVKPTNFGVKDDPGVAEDPREHGRGDFMDFPLGR